MSINNRPVGFHFGPANDEDPDFSFETWLSDDSIPPDLTNGSTQPTSSSTESYLSRTHQDDVLMDFFKKNQCPDGSQTLELAKHTKLNINDVEDWFRSHRDLAAYLISDHSKQKLVRPAELVENGWGASPTLQSNELSKECLLSDKVPHNEGDVLVDGDRSESSSTPSKKQKTLYDAQLPSISTSLVTKKPKPVLQCVGDDHSCQKQFQTSDRTKLCNHENECHFPAQAFRCDECSPPRWFYKPANGKSHLVSVHNFAKGPQLNQYFKCQRHYIDHMFHDTCGYEGCTETFDDRRESLTHIRNHSEQGFGRLQWTHRCRRTHRLEDHPDMCHCASYEDADGNDDGNGRDDGDDQADQDHEAPPKANDEPGESSRGQGRSGHDAKDGSSHPDEASGSENGGQVSFKSVSVWSTNTNASVKEEDGLDHQQPLPILGGVLGKSKSPTSNPNVIPVINPSRMLGAGAFGAVYEVRIWPDHDHDRMSIPGVFALKEFTAAPARPGVLDAFERERAVLASLKNKHPHILQYFGSFRSEDTFNIMLGPVADMNLAQYLKTCPGYGSPPLLEAARRGHISVAKKLLDAGAKIDTQRKRHDSVLGNTGNMSTSTCDKSPLPNTGLASAVESRSRKIRGMWTVTNFHDEDEENVLIQSMGCLASALEYLHTAPHKYGPIIHGDIKPSNILVFLGNNTCSMRLADFGSSSMTAHAERTTKARTRAFTRAYQPPECKEKWLPPSRSSDIWSLGCVFSEVLIFMLSGHRYTKGANSSEFWHMRAKEWLLDLSGQEKEHSRTKVEKRLPYDIVLRMLSMKPSERPTARAVVYLLPRKCDCAEKSVNPSVPRSQSSDAVAPLSVSKADVFEQKKATIGSGKDLHMPSQRSCEGILELRSDNSIMARPEHGRITSQEIISDDVTLHSGSQPPSWCPSWSYLALRLSVGSHELIDKLDMGSYVNLISKLDTGSHVNFIGCKFDVGSCVNIISKRHCEEMYREIVPLKNDRTRLTLVNGKTLTAMGKVELQFSFTKAPAKLFRALFHVLEEVDAPIIGYETMMDLEVLTKRNDLAEKLHSPPDSLPQCHLLAQPKKLIRCAIERREVEAFPDTGSDVNFVSAEFASRIKEDRLTSKTSRNQKTRTRINQARRTNTVT